ncbi:MAG: Na/Pi symporter [Firmicutes bacterium]|nr:Na/Pi symporter [Bacillota bacterium]MBU4554381.1 Na/Pi symporter [Bacillota bacterium]MBV1727666.1 Na/Pi symporter [Desulforudis sp.]MBV1736279.1 Na/Pi symporter [Desulforudis sp.]MBV1769250.1 Na/Pi symporter [Desulforudis sp.]
MISMLVFMSGIGLLLIGLRLLQAGLEQAAKPKIKTVLLRLAGNPLRAMFTGTAVTALVQSSTAVTVLSIGFVNTSLMTLPQAIGIILGANIGTCLTIQLMTLDLGSLAPVLIALGLILWRTGGRLGPLGQSLAGFGSIFLALELMSLSLSPLAESSWFQEICSALTGNYLTAAVAGALLTGLLHSSAISTGVVIALAREGLIGLPEAVALILGNNVGTCFTALIASLAGSTAGKRVAVAHLLINLAGAVILLPVVPALAALLPLLGSGIDHQVANAHTVFNVVSSLVILPFIYPFTRLLYRIVPDNGYRRMR